MTPLLSHPLVLKYFGCGCAPLEPEWPKHTGSCYSWRARAVIEAMQEQIKKGERYLWVPAEVEPRIEIAGNLNYDITERFHPYFLRLPSRFQSPASEKECCEYHSDRWRNDTTVGEVIPWCGEHKTTAPIPKCRCAMQDICSIHPEMAENTNKPVSQPDVVEKTVKEIMEKFDALVALVRGTK